MELNRLLGKAEEEGGIVQGAPSKSLTLLDAIKSSVEKTAKSLENISFSQSLTRSAGKPSKEVVRIKQLKR